MSPRRFVVAFLMTLAASACSTESKDFRPEPSCLSDADCQERLGDTAKCFRLGISGPSACAIPSAPVTGCEVERSTDECCSTDDCNDARCFEIVRQPVQCSATAGFDVWNACVADECESDADCPGGLCTPDGYGEGRTCVPAACETDADCSETEGGVCTLLDLGCCEEAIGGAPTRVAEIACAYPGDGCQSDMDCPEDELCVVRDGRTSCSSSCP